MSRARETFATRIRRLRTAQGITVRQLADALDLKSAGYISRVEARGEIPSPELTCRLATILGDRPEELLALARQEVLQKTEKDLLARHQEVLSLYRKPK